MMMSVNIKQQPQAATNSPPKVSSDDTSRHISTSASEQDKIRYKRKLEWYRQRYGDDFNPTKLPRYLHSLEDFVAGRVKIELNRNIIGSTGKHRRFASSAASSSSSSFERFSRSRSRSRSNSPPGLIIDEKRCHSASYPNHHHPHPHHHPYSYNTHVHHSDQHQHHHHHDDRSLSPTTIGSGGDRSRSRSRSPQQFSSSSNHSFSLHDPRIMKYRNAPLSGWRSSNSPPPAQQQQQKSPQRFTFHSSYDLPQLQSHYQQQQQQISAQSPLSSKLYAHYLPNLPNSLACPPLIDVPKIQAAATSQPQSQIILQRSISPKSAQSTQPNCQPISSSISQNQVNSWTKDLLRSQNYRYEKSSSPITGAITTISTTTSTTTNTSSSAIISTNSTTTTTTTTTTSSSNTNNAIKDLKNSSVENSKSLKHNNEAKQVEKLFPMIVAESQQQQQQNNKIPSSFAANELSRQASCAPNFEPLPPCRANSVESGGGACAAEIAAADCSAQFILQKTERKIYFTPCFERLLQNGTRAWSQLKLGGGTMIELRFAQAAAFLATAQSLLRAIEDRDSPDSPAAASAQPKDEQQDAEMAELRALLNRYALPLPRHIRRITAQYGDVCDAFESLRSFDVGADVRALIRTAAQIIPIVDEWRERAKREFFAGLDTPLAKSRYPIEAIRVIDDAELRRVVGRAWLPTALNDGRFYWIVANKIAMLVRSNLEMQISPPHLVDCFRTRQRPKWWQTFKQHCLPETIPDRLDFLFTDWNASDLFANLADRSPANDILTPLGLRWDSPAIEQLDMLTGRTTATKKLIVTMRILPPMLSKWIAQANREANPHVNGSNGSNGSTTFASSSTSPSTATKIITTSTTNTSNTSAASLIQMETVDSGFREPHHGSWMQIAQISSTWDRRYIRTPRVDLDREPVLLANHFPPTVIYHAFDRAF